MTRTRGRTSRRGGLIATVSLFASAVVSGGTATAERRAVAASSGYSAESWAAFSSARNATAALTRGEDKDATAGAKLQNATDGPVMVRGLKTLVADYRTRSASRYTSVAPRTPIPLPA